MTADLDINIKYHGVPDKHREELERLTLKFLQPLEDFFPGLVTFEPVYYTPGSWKHTEWCPSPSGHEGDCWLADRRAKGLPDTEPALTIAEVKP